MLFSELYVDLLGFLGDIGAPLLDEKTKQNVRESGVRLIHTTTSWPGQDWPATLEMHRQAVRGLEAHADTFRIVRNRRDLAELGGRVGLILGIQDPTCVEDRVDRLFQLFQEGVRVIQIAYQGRNNFGSGFLCREGDTGLTKTGRKFVQAAHETGLILDLSHLSPRTSLESISVSNGPTMISHTTAAAVYDHPRGSVDELLREIAKREESIVGCLTMTFFLDPEKDGLSPFIDHIRHIAGIVGTHRVGIGSDGPVGGFTDPAGAEKIFREKTRGLMDPRGELRSRWPTHIPEIAEVRRGFDVIRGALAEWFTKEEVSSILGVNAWRFFERSLPEEA
jgi:membrane dipeptidase